MVKFTQLVAVVLVGCAAAAFALAQDEEAVSPAARADPAEVLLDDRGADRAAKPGAPGHDAAARAALDRALPEVTFDQVGFSDVVDFLRDITHANIFVNWRALESAGIDRNAPVSLRLREVAFGKALDVILDAVGGDEVDLRYEVDRGVITISTADADAHTRAYDVRDILVAKVAAPGADQAERLATLTKLVTGSVAPATWRGKVGGDGAVRAAEGKLIITQTPENHDAIANLLKHTRALLSLPPVEEPAPVVPDPME